MSSTLTLWTNVPGATVRLWSAAIKPEWAATIEDGHSSDGAWDERKTDDAGHTSFMYVPAGPSTAYVTAPGYQPLAFDVVMPDDGAKPLTLAPALPQRIYAYDHNLWHADGTRHTICGSTELLLPVIYDREGPGAILPVLSERQSLGFNNLRCLWQKDIRNKGDRWQMPLDKLAPFLALCAEYGFWVQGTILADCQVVNPSEVSQQQRVRDVRAATAGIDSHIEQIGNEAFKNGFDPRHFSKPGDRLAINASGLAGRGTERWDLFCFSAAREPVRKAIMEYGPIEYIYGDGDWGGIPAMVDESAKPGTAGEGRGEYATPHVFYRMGAQARSGVGGRFHHWAGTGNQDPNVPISRLFTDLERDCARAFVAGLQG